MPGPRIQFISILLCLLALAAGTSMWFYVDVILVRSQLNDAAVRNIPRGNLSDLYPRWLGARELLLHGKNPYSREVTIDIQKGYYGRPLDRALPNDPKDQQAFAYPVYVIFLLAPTIKLPFSTVQFWFTWVLVGVSIATVWLWLRVLRWNLSFAGMFVCAVLLLGSFPEVQGLKLQQLTLLVAFLLAAGMALVSAGQLFLGGACLALATIKPQLALPLVTWMLIWTAGNWKLRWRLAAGLIAVMSLFLVAAEFVLPGWSSMFWHATREYLEYTGNQSVLDQLVNWGLGPRGGSALAAIAALASGVLLWRGRADAADSQSFGSSAALVMALTVLIIPMTSPYNQVLLLPSVLFLARERSQLASNSAAIRIIYVGAVFALAWAWLASMGLAATWCFSPPLAMEGWKLPLYATFALPVLIFALTLFAMRQHTVLRVPDATR
ncbi:MAG: glycosyltransferase family 87 protein [Candidatus Sulfotelmatobacter sp.]